MDLKEVRLEIIEELDKRRKALALSFVEEKHIYYMRDTKGKIRSNFPSVSKVVKRFHEPFDAEAKSLKMANGDPVEQQRLLTEWKISGDNSTNMGSRVHYFLEKNLIEQYGDYKEVRQPIFKCDDEQIAKSERMIAAGTQYLELMHERGAVLLDTEIILGDNILGYTGQPDDAWIMMNKEKSDFGFVITDWKTNQPKNFVPQFYNKYLYPPFQDVRDYALSHYFIQIPLYGRLIMKMLEGTKFENKKVLGGVVTLLKDDGTFTEYKVPAEINTKVLNMDLIPFIESKW